MADGIEWPRCVSFVGVLKPTGFFSSMFSSPKCRVFSVSGGNLQHSMHPNLIDISAGSASESLKDKATSRDWELKDLATLDGFAYDPRDPGCTDHAAVNGGLLGAKIEEHSDTEVTLTTDMGENPLRIQFLNKETCEVFKSLVEKNKVCCSRKFQATVGEQVQGMQAAKKG